MGEGDTADRLSFGLRDRLAAWIAVSSTEEPEQLSGRESPYLSSIKTS
jgi:hypothetical protein